MKTPAKTKAAKQLISNEQQVETEQEKFEAIQFENRLFRPAYRPSLTLSAAQPSANGGSGSYTPAPYGVFVRKNTGEQQEFHCDLPANVLSKTEKIIWQVSLVPFDGRPIKGGAPAPAGLLQNGTLSKQQKSFEVDFDKVVKAENTLKSPKGTTFSLIKPNTFASQILLKAGVPNRVAPRVYYVRAFPVDTAGNSIGDTGSGLPVLYGDPVTVQNTGNGLFPALSVKFSLKPARWQGDVSYNGEFPNNFIDSDNVSMTNDSTRSYSVLPTGFPANTAEILIQVSRVPFSNTYNSWEDTSALVYEKSVFLDDADFSAFKDNGYGCQSILRICAAGQPTDR